MINHMKKYIYHITMLLAVGLALVACNDKADSDYTPASPTPETSMQVYFDASNENGIIVAAGQNTAEITVSRVKDTEEAEVPIVCKSADEGLTIPASIKFEAGSKTATLTIGIGDITPDKPYNFSLAIPDAYADHYTKLDGSEVYNSYVLQAEWNTYIKNDTITWTVDNVKHTWYTPIERLGSTNRYRIKDFVGSGQDMVFVVGGDAAGNAGYYTMSPYSNYVDATDGSASYFVWTDAEKEPLSWTVGSKKVTEWGVMYSYGSTSYSYISFEQGYGMFGTYYTIYDDGSYDYYNYVNLHFAPVGGLK